MASLTIEKLRSGLTPYLPSRTLEPLAKLIYDHARREGFPVTEVTLWETENCFATYTG